MAINTWSSAGSTDWSTDANWSLGTKPTTSDDVVFDATSVINCTLTEASVCLTITTAANYSGNFSFGGFTLTCESYAIFNGTGSITKSAAFTTGNAGGVGGLYIGSGVGTFTGGYPLIMKGTGNLQIVKTGVLFSDFTCAYSGKTITFVDAGSVTGFTGQINLQGGTLTINSGKYIRLYLSATSTPLVITGGSTINGAGYIHLSLNTTSAVTTTIPAITVTGTVGFFISRILGATGTWTINQNGALSVPTFYSLSNAVAGTSTYNTNNYAFTASVLLDAGVNTAGGTFTYNWGSSIITIGSQAASYNTGTCNWNLGTSQSEIKGNYVLSSNWTVDAGTSLITFTTNSANITTNGKILYDVTFNGAGKTYTLQDALTCTGDIIVTAGTVNTATKAVSVVDLSVNGTSVLNSSGSAVTITGNLTLAAGCTHTIDATTAYTFTANGAIVTTNGKALPQCTFNNNAAINDGCTISRLIWGVDGKTLTFEAGQTFTITNLTAANFNGSAAALNGIRSSSAATQFTFALPNAATLEYMNVKDCALTGYEITVDDGTSLNSGNNSGWIFPSLNSKRNFPRGILRGVLRGV